MNRRAILKRITYSLALVTSMTWSPLAFADGDDDDDDDHDDDRDHDDDDDDDNKGSGNSRRDDDDDDDRNDNKGSGSSRRDDDDDDDDHNGQGHGHDDEDHALEATQSNQAMPLRKIIQNFRNDIGGNITEIRLFQRSDILIYRFQYINREGHVVFVKYNAATGQIIKD